MVKRGVPGGWLAPPQRQSSCQRLVSSSPVRSGPVWTTGRLIFEDIGRKEKSQDGIKFLGLGQKVIVGKLDTSLTTEKFALFGVVGC
jgi:hypothetical protein